MKEIERSFQRARVPFEELIDRTLATFDACPPGTWRPLKASKQAPLVVTAHSRPVALSVTGEVTFEPEVFTVIREAPTALPWPIRELGPNERWVKTPFDETPYVIVDHEEPPATALAGPEWDAARQQIAEIHALLVGEPSAVKSAAGGRPSISDILSLGLQVVAAWQEVRGGETLTFELRWPAGKRPAVKRIR